MKVKINNLGSSGEGVGRHEGRPVFVEGALPGEEVEVDLHIEKKTYSKGRLSTILSPSPLRTQPPCPIYGRCGGCQLQHLAYEGQLSAKRERVVEAMRRIGGFADVEVEACIPSPQEFAYRNKIQLRACRDAEGRLDLGLFARGSHDVVTTEHCFIHCELGEEVFQQVRSALREQGVQPYDPATGRGELRTVLIRTAVQRAEALLVLVTNGPASAAAKRAAELLVHSCPALKGVVNNINTRRDNVILGNAYRVLAGEGAIYETICGLDFKVSPASFFQVNALQAEALYAGAAEFAALTGREFLLDAYCGVGTLSLILSRYCSSVLGVECVPEAIDDARENAERNGIEGVDFRCGRAEDLVDQLGQPDVVLMNPPRGGCEKRFLEGMAALGPSRMVYISCDPATLARDLKLLANLGYQVERLRPYDMFPQTMHVETVALVIPNLLQNTIFGKEKASGIGRS